MFPVNRCGLHYSGEGEYFSGFYLMSIGFLVFVFFFFIFEEAAKSSIGVRPGYVLCGCLSLFVQEL